MRSRKRHFQTHQVIYVRDCTRDERFGRNPTPRIATPRERAMIAGMSTNGNKDPLHGITLERIVTELVEAYGWDDMAARVPVRCFQFNPSIKSSLTFLRKTPWARKKIERWYVDVLAPRGEEQGQ